jgi:tetratricopeptide (TPR) repeat protein
MKKYILFTFLALLSPYLFAQVDNAELKIMYEEDQGARMTPDVDWKKLIKEDSMRQSRVDEMLRKNLVKSAKDHYHAAMIFQHGSDTTDSYKAVTLMKKAIALDSTINPWLLAAAIDRHLMRKGEPQIYGTQYIKMHDEEKWRRYNIDSTKVTDEERRKYNVETLAEQKIKERSMNLLPLWSFYSSEKSIDKTIEHIKAEVKKGNHSTYNVSESGINEFGYELMGKNLLSEALKVFELNTKLFPSGFNTYDSYGECLLKLGQKKEAKTAYEKSLQLNPKNENAKKVLAEMK